MKRLWPGALVAFEPAAFADPHFGHVPAEGSVVKVANGAAERSCACWGLGVPHPPPV